MANPRRLCAASFIAGSAWAASDSAAVSARLERGAASEALVVHCDDAPFVFASFGPSVASERRIRSSEVTPQL